MGRSTSTTTRVSCCPGSGGPSSSAEVSGPSPLRERFVRAGWFAGLIKLAPSAEGPAPRLEKLGRPLLHARASAPAGAAPQPLEGDQALAELEGPEGGEAGRGWQAGRADQEPGHGGQGGGDGAGADAGGHRE